MGHSEAKMTTMEPIDIAVADIPETEMQKFREVCWRHTLGFVIPALGDESDRIGDVRQAGTGTLVRTISGLAIVTAAHVADALQKCGEFGIIARSPHVTHHYLNADNFVFHKLGKEPYDPETLDIALIEIPLAGSHTFERLVVALNLAPHLLSISEANFTPLRGLAGVFGFVDEFTRDLAATDGLVDHKGFSLGGALGIADNWNREQANDVISLEAVRLTDTDPTSWSGVSGGGLWQVDVTQGEDGGVSLGKPVLCGVLFYEGEKNESGRRLFAQGPRALLRVVAEAQAHGYGERDV